MMDTDEMESKVFSSSSSLEIFENRKQDHIRLALDPNNEAQSSFGLEHIFFIHNAFPELDFSDVSIDTYSLNKHFCSPFFISSMTAGHEQGIEINCLLARAASERGWMMGVGSQRRQLFDNEMKKEWEIVRKAAPRAVLLGNLGLSQMISTPVEKIQRLVDSIEAAAMIIHTNPLQECLQPEGTPQFKGGFEALARLCRQLSVPVVVKETGCGFSLSTLRQLNEVGVAAVDISGLGGTHWGRIEGARSPQGSIKQNASKTFKNWGIPTLKSLLYSLEIDHSYEVWASGGVRSGLDGAKLLAMGAQLVGVARPLLEACSKGEESLHQMMELFEFELKTAMFCTGCKNIQEMKSKGIWEWAHQI